MRTFESFANMHAGKKALIIGLGVSAGQVVGKDIGDMITIGVNDIGKIYTPKYLLTVDMSGRFLPARADEIRNTEAEFLFTQIAEWSKVTRLAEKVVLIKLGSRELKNIDNIGTFDFSCNSPYIAVIMAYQMGCREIGVIGVDFTDNHVHMNDGKHELVRGNRLPEIERDYERLSANLKSRGCDLYNLSDISVLKSMRKIEFEKFIGK